MPDTGAPWNIPYVEPSDLVRDYPAASEDLADAVAAGLTAASSAGIGSNVVSVTKTNRITTTSTSFQDALTATITPSTATSKVLIVASFSIGDDGNTGVSSVLTRGTTVLLQGDAAGSRVRAFYGTRAGNSRPSFQSTLVFVDNPLSSSAVEYRIRYRSGAGGTVAFNGSVEDADSAVATRNASTLTLIEVAV